MTVLAEVAMGQPSILVVLVAVVGYVLLGMLGLALFLWAWLKLEARARAAFASSEAETPSSQERRAAEDLGYGGGSIAERGQWS